MRLPQTKLSVSRGCCQATLLCSNEPSRFQQMHMPPKRSSLKHLSERLFLHWFLLIVKSSVSKFPCKKCLHSAWSCVRVNTKVEFSKMFGKLRSIQTYNCKDLISISKQILRNIHQNFLILNSLFPAQPIIKIIIGKAFKSYHFVVKYVCDQ